MPPVTEFPKEYLGDGVYASFDGYAIWLKTEAQIPMHEICLEPREFANLLAFVKRVEKFVERFKADAKAKQPTD